MTVTDVRNTALLLLLFLLAAACLACAGARPQPQPQTGPSPAHFSGAVALKHALAVTAFGPRPPGTPEHEKTQEYILTHLGRLGLKPEVDAFTARTPLGPRPMKNILVKVPGRSDRAVLIGGHYDTKLERTFRFVGANDGGSSTGVLLELARVLKNSPPAPIGVWLAFFDGEEPLAGRWTDEDSLYGSRRMAAGMKASGDSRKLVGVMVVDMIGDRNLDILRDLHSTGWFIELVRDVASRMKLGHVFSNNSQPIGDDHVPFAQIGLPVVDLIDLNYGRDNSYWHSPDDTPDKISAASMEAVGRIVLGTIPELAKR